MRLGDLRTIKGARHQRLVRAEIVDVDLAVDLRRVELGAALPQQRRLLALAFDQDIHRAADPLLLALAADRLLQFHQRAAARLDGALWDFYCLVEMDRLRAL